MSKLAIGGVTRVAIDGTRIEMEITSRAPSLLESQPPAS